jgi:hypothetical protein
MCCQNELRCLRLSCFFAPRSSCQRPQMPACIVPLRPAFASNPSARMSFCHRLGRPLGPAAARVKTATARMGVPLRRSSHVDLQPDEAPCILDDLIQLPEGRRARGQEGERAGGGEGRRGRGERAGGGEGRRGEGRRGEGRRAMMTSVWEGLVGIGAIGRTPTMSRQLSRCCWRRPFCVPRVAAEFPQISCDQSLRSDKSSIPRIPSNVPNGL